MTLFIAAKFSPEDMPVLFDAGPLRDLRPDDFVVVPRSGGEDVAFVSGLEHKSVHQLKMRRDSYPRVLRRATPPEIEAWWDRKDGERTALLLAKKKALELKLDIKISHVRFDAAENRAVFQFTSEQRIDFRALVKELNAILKMRIELWQIGVRDEARMIDGFGICGQQTCCSTWLTEFRPINLRMAKDQDINLPPNKLSGQCGRLLCCLSYEVDQYRDIARGALSKGATVKWKDLDVIIVDRNLIAEKYIVAEAGGTTHHVPFAEIHGESAKVPDQMKHFGRKFMAQAREELGVGETDTPPPPDDAQSEVPPAGFARVAESPSSSSTEVAEIQTHEDLTSAVSPRDRSAVERSGGGRSGRRRGRGRGRGERGDDREPRAEGGGPPRQDPGRQAGPGAEGSDRPASADGERRNRDRDRQRQTQRPPQSQPQGGGQGPTAERGPKPPRRDAHPPAPGGERPDSGGDAAGPPAPEGDGEGRRRSGRPRRRGRR